MLIELAYPYTDGYKPRGHYQELLYRVVERRLSTSNHLDAAVAIVIEKIPAARPTVIDLLSILVATLIPDLGGGKLQDRPAHLGLATKRNFLELESRNRALGVAGEKLVMDYEHERLWRDGRWDLAERIEHVAETKGDGLGFDISSFDADGRERLIEVKTTRFSSFTPFFVSRNEVNVSSERADDYRICPLFLSQTTRSSRYCRAHSEGVVRWRQSSIAPVRRRGSCGPRARVLKPCWLIVAAPRY